MAVQVRAQKTKTFQTVNCVQIKIWRNFLSQKVNKKTKGSCHISIKTFTGGDNNEGQFLSVKFEGGRFFRYTAKETECLYKSSPIAILDFYDFDIKKLNETITKAISDKIEWPKELLNESFSFIAPLYVLHVAGLGKYVDQKNSISTIFIKILALFLVIDQIIHFIKGHPEPTFAVDVIDGLENVFHNDHIDTLDVLLHLSCNEIVDFFRKAKEKEISENPGLKADLWTLWESAATGDAVKVRKIIEQGKVNPNAENYTLAGIFSGYFYESGRYTTPLLIALRRNHPKVVAELLKYSGLEVDSPLAQYTHETPLALASINGDLDSFKALFIRHRNISSHFYPGTSDVPYTMGLLNTALNKKHWGIALEILEQERIDPLKFILYARLITEKAELFKGGPPEFQAAFNQFKKKFNSTSVEIVQAYRKTQVPIPGYFSDRSNLIIKQRIIQEVNEFEKIISDLMSKEKTNDNGAEILLKHVYRFQGKLEQYSSQHEENDLNKGAYEYYKSCRKALFKVIEGQLTEKPSHLTDTPDDNKYNEQSIENRSRERHRI